MNTAAHATVDDRNDQQPGGVHVFAAQHGDSSAGPSWASSSGKHRTTAAQTVLATVSHRRACPRR
jgi:hypothetical protein